MNLSLNKKIIRGYKSLSQQGKRLTEDWMAREMYCINCGYSHLFHDQTNKKVFDFLCEKCLEQFELKGASKKLSNKIIAGAYGALMERLQEHNNPHFYFLRYSRERFKVLELFVIPKNHFLPKMIGKRKALAKTARRAGWVGSYIDISEIPEEARVYIIKNEIICSKKEVIKKWKQAVRVRNTQVVPVDGWLLDSMNLVQSLKKEFTLKDMYAFERVLREKYPNNKHIKDKLRQQLQILRNEGYVEFVGKGYYRVR